MFKLNTCLVLFNENSIPLKSNFNDKQIQILEVAETLFAEKGFDGTSIRNIAKVAKINIAWFRIILVPKNDYWNRLLYTELRILKINWKIYYWKTLNLLTKSIS